MTATSTGELAIRGGPRAVSDDIRFHAWPPVDADDERLVLEALRQNNHSGGGPHVAQLRDEFAAWSGRRFCLPTNSGTAALHMCVAGCGIGPGDEVITPALSWTSSATSILQHCAIPVFVDVDWDSMLMDPSLIEAAISERTRAIMVVHYWGVPCDMDAILAIAERHGLMVIEDACQAHGARFDGRQVGRFGHCAAFSCNQNKNLCGGEGGFFVSDDEAVYERAKAVMSFSDMRPVGSGREYHPLGLGYKYGTANLQAAFTLGQLRKLDASNAAAVANWQRLHQALEGTPHLQRPFASTRQAGNGYAYPLRVDPVYAQRRGVALPALTDAIAEALTAEGARVNRAAWMLPAHGVFQAKNFFGKGAPWSAYARGGIGYDCAAFPTSQRCVDTCLWNINLHRPPNGDEQIDAVAVAVGKVFSQLDQLQPVGAPA